MNFFKRLFKLNNSSITDISDEIKQEKNVVKSHSTNIGELPKVTPNENTLSIDEKKQLIEKIAKGEESINDIDTNDLDTLFEDAARLIVQSQMGSISLIQRRMKVDYNRAGRLMNQLEKFGIVGPNLGSAAREIRIKTEIELDQFLQNVFQICKFDLMSFYEENKLEIEQKKSEYLQQRREENFKQEKEIIRQELLEKERKRQLQKEVFKELLDEGAIKNSIVDKEWSREPIPQDVMDKVWNRDAGKCVKCGSQENLEFDHIIPFSKGGANTYRNLQILCKKCNIDKSNKIG